MPIFNPPQYPEVFDINDRKLLHLGNVVQEKDIECIHATVRAVVTTAIDMYPPRRKPGSKPTNWNAMIVSWKEDKYITCCLTSK